jgi:replicative superfamily II helicase
MASKWDKAPWLKTLKLRLTYGVAADMVELCQIPNVGTVRAGRLKRAGVRTLSDFLSYDEKDIMKFMKCSKKLAEEAAEGARLIELKESLDG